jgi:DNA-binding NarL/FixJ family response regulator
LISIQEGKRAISSSIGSISPTSEMSPVSVHTQISEPSDRSSKGARQSQPTIGELPKRNVQIAIAVIDEHSFTRECITKSLRERSSLLDIAAFAACDDCLRSSCKYDLILYHSHESVATRINSQPVVNIKNLLEIAPVIVLCDVDSVESILAAFESGARGYIPTASTALELAVEIIHLVKAGGTFVPPSILCARAISREGATTGAITAQQFTPRQSAVLERLKLGKTNKIIAHELKMSESTVKVHIRNIMKRLRATNRTEVVRRVHELELEERRGTH